MFPPAFAFTGVVVTRIVVITNPRPAIVQAASDTGVATVGVATGAGIVVIQIVRVTLESRTAWIAVNQSNIRAADRTTATGAADLAGVGLLFAVAPALLLPAFGLLPTPGLGRTPAPGLVFRG